MFDCAALRLLLTLVLPPLSSLIAQERSTPGDAKAALVAAIDQQVEEQLQRGIAANEPGVAVIGVLDGQVVLRRVRGKASLELDVDIAPEMRFCLASATKPFTATAIMMLVEAGALRLDESAAARLDGIEFDPRITIAHLLSHTSGLPDFFDIEGFGEADLHRSISADDLCRAVNGQRLRFEPGQREQYSNLNYALLARIVEVVSGKSWEAFLGERVFAPAGMKHSSVGGDRRVIPGAVANYEQSVDSWRPAAPLNYTRGFGLGSMFSTVDDLAAFDSALRAGKLLKPETIARMHQPALLADGSAAGHGLGWVVTERRGHLLIHHSGSINGWRSHMVRIPAAGVFVAVLSNRGEEQSPVVAMGMVIAMRLADMKR